MSIRIGLKLFVLYGNSATVVALYDMKTKKSPICRFFTYQIRFLLCPLLTLVLSVASAEPANSPADPRPQQSDTASSQLIANYLTVTGGSQAHLKLRNVVAEGTIKESILQRNFRLIETVDGKRHITYYWTHLGRKYREIYVHDGLQTWKQALEPEKLKPSSYDGADGAHFANHCWLIQPFTLPLLADYVFKYQGAGKVAGRPAHVVKAYGKNKAHSWFYFDQEKFLLTRWGGAGQIAGVQENMDYRAIGFKASGGVLLPTNIDLIAENAVYGRVHFDRIAVNQDLNDVSFLMPRSTTPTLRQRAVAPKN